MARFASAILLCSSRTDPVLFQNGNTMRVASTSNMASDSAAGVTKKPLRIQIDAPMCRIMTAGSDRGITGIEAALNSSIALEYQIALCRPLTRNTALRQIRAASTSIE